MYIAYYSFARVWQRGAMVIATAAETDDTSSNLASGRILKSLTRTESLTTFFPIELNLVHRDDHVFKLFSPAKNVNRSYPKKNVSEEFLFFWHGRQSTARRARSVTSRFEAMRDACLRWPDDKCTR
jgi:hypothetical protein